MYLLLQQSYVWVYVSYLGKASSSLDYLELIFVVNWWLYAVSDMVMVFKVFKIPKIQDYWKVNSEQT